MNQSYTINTTAQAVILNRMAATTVKIHEAEKQLKKMSVLVGVDSDVKMNPLTKYINELDNTLMRYFRMMRESLATGEQDKGPQNFIDLIDGDK